MGQADVDSDVRGVQSVASASSSTASASDIARRKGLPPRTIHPHRSLYSNQSGRKREAKDDCEPQIAALRCVLYFVAPLSIVGTLLSGPETSTQ